MSDVADFLRRGCMPVSRPTGELVKYARMMEALFLMIAKDYGFNCDMKVWHDAFCPHWADVMEGNHEHER